MTKCEGVLSEFVMFSANIQTLYTIHFCCLHTYVVVCTSSVCVSVLPPPSPTPGG